MKELTIGQLASEAGVNVETIRYYQRVNLIKEPHKPYSGFRHYPQEIVERIKFIKRAQQLGFKLQEIGELLEIGDGHCKDVRTRAEVKLDQIQDQVRDLKAMEKTLKTLIDACNTGHDPAHCPIVESLTSKSPKKQ